MSDKSKKLKKNLIFLSLSIAIILFLTWNTTAFPSNPGNPLNTGCHTTEASGVNITHNLTNFEYSKGESFDVEIQVTGGPTGYYVLFHPEQKNNDLVEFSPSDRIQDNSIDDSNSADGNVSVTYLITLPDEDINITLDFFVIYANNSVKYSKVESFNITVGLGINTPISNPFTGVVDHFSIYLGAPALILLALGTILYERDKEKYTKTHGILAAISFTLTTVNVTFIAIQPELWLSFFSDWIWGIHIILGVGGWIAGLIAAITGISGIRVKWPGYTALICWSLNFFVGILQMGVRI
jgi:hypothetical protein